MKRIIAFTAVLSLMMLITGCNTKSDRFVEIDLYPVGVGNEYQYINKEGQIVINPQFSEATLFRDGLALVQTSTDNPRWGYINKEGQFEINAQYIRATVFSEGLAWVVMENAAPSAIDKTGNVKFTLQNADHVSIFKEGLAAYKTVDDAGKEKWGFVDKEGVVKINPQFAEVSYFGEGLCAVRNHDGKWGFINKEGLIEINYQFDDAHAFYAGRCLVATAEKVGVIDKQGRYVINPQFEEMIHDGDNFLIKQDGRYGWCDVDGKITINPQFSHAFPFNGNKLASVESGDNFGYIDQTGKMIINPQFDGALPFNGKIALVMSNERIGFINAEGRYVINPQYDEIADDAVLQIAYGRSQYESVASDYFRVNLQLGNLYERNLSGGADEWRFILNGGSIYSIDFKSEDFDPKMSLVTKEGLTVAEDDDGGDGNNARIIVTPADETKYVLNCFTYGEGSGNYSLKVQAIPSRTLEVNNTGQGHLSRGYSSIGPASDNLWIVRLEQSKQYEIDLMSDDFDTYFIMLYNGSQVASDDDGGSGSNSRVVFTPQQTGYYVLVVTSYNDSGSGNYRLSAQARR